MDVKLRKLQKEDGLTSWKWRNNPEIWEYTSTRPSGVTQEIETQWIEKVTKRTNERRYAIIADNVYVGNVQLLDITDNDAEFHIFIGNKNYWGKGVATIATNQILEIAKNELHLKKVYLEVNKNHSVAQKLYEKTGFNVVSNKDDMIVMEKVF